MHKCRTEAYVCRALLSWKMPQEICRSKIQPLHTDTLMAKGSLESELTGQCAQCQQGGQRVCTQEKHLGESPGRVLLWGWDNADEYVHFEMIRSQSDNLLHVKRPLGATNPFSTAMKSNPV